MTVDVKFGRLIETEDGPWIDWPGIEISDKSTRQEDGTSPKHTIFAGFPHRPFSTHGYYDFVRRIPIANAIHELCKPLYPNTNDVEWRKVDQTLIDLIDQLPETDGDIDTDRAKWYKYWSRRALAEFGDDAVIFIF